GTSTATGGVAVVESKTPSSASAPGATSGQPAAPAEKSFFGIKLSMFGFGSKSATPSLGVNGAAGTPSGTSNVSGSLTSPSKELAKETPAEVKPVANCYVVNFKHKASSHHKTRQACAQHRNFLKLTDSTINLKSVCVRVDGIPVAYEQVKEKGKSEVSGLMLAGIAGPDSKISLKYCINKHDCNEDCKVPKDEFMDAIGGTDPAENGKVAVVRWDPSDAENDRDVVAEMDSEIKKELSESAVFADWVGNAEASECKLNKNMERKVANSN
ncbi:MAG: hypothetical protein H7222_07040, partial [Methylotenera sp.]|nr:hypothetical protein [Oligoflexia bacterium]